MPVNSSLSCSCQFIQSTLGASIEIVLQTDVVSLFAETISFAVHHLLVPNGLGFLSPPVNIKVSGREPSPTTRTPTPFSPASLDAQSMKLSPIISTPHDVLVLA